MSSPAIALVTSAPGRPLDEDLPPLVEALDRCGAAVSVVDWDDPDVAWSEFDLVVIRSTWDYTDRVGEFLDWCDRCGAGTRLVNDARVVRWNTDKVYLGALADRGVRVVPTTFLHTLADLDGSLAAGTAFPATEQFVVKPTVSAGSRDTVRYHAGDLAAAETQARELLAAGRPVMVQPYQYAVDAEGETALIYFGGEFSHAINKGPLLVAGRGAHGALFAEERITAVEPTAAQLALGSSCLAGVMAAIGRAGDSLPYARIDVLSDNDGELSLLEAELTEPSLFFESAEGSADRFAEVLLEAVSRDATNVTRRGVASPD